MALASLSPLPTLTPENFPDYVAKVVARHAELAQIVAEFGVPAPFRGETSFAGLVRIILAQQVASSAAEAAGKRLLEHLGTITVSKVLAKPEALEKARLTRQKRGYILTVAEAIAQGELDVQALEQLPDDAVRSKLTSLKGIGPWSAEIYLMSCLGRVDIFPAGDLALRKALMYAQGLAVEPTINQARDIAVCYAPYRTVAARILWHWYVSH